MKVILTYTKAGADTGGEGAGRGVTPVAPEPRKNSRWIKSKPASAHGIWCPLQTWRVLSDSEEKQSVPPAPEAVPSHTDVTSSDDHWCEGQRTLWDKCLDCGHKNKEMGSTQVCQRAREHGHLAAERTASLRPSG